MAHQMLRPLRRTTHLLHPKTLILFPLHFQPSLHDKDLFPFPLCPSHTNPPSPTRNYMSAMRKSAFDDRILRLLRHEIQYELDRSPPDRPIGKFGSYTVDDRPGENWIRLKRKFENEEIKVEATMFDGAVPIPKSGGARVTEDVQLHITMTVNITKGDDDVLEIVCSAWPDSIEITKLFIRRSNKIPAEPYVGPEFKELDDELQDSLYEFLEARGIDDGMAVFFLRYMKNKDKTECIRWMNTVKSYIEEK